MILKPVERKYAVVTGAGRGIGHALVEELLRQRYIVFPVVRSLADVESLDNLSPGRVRTVRCDISDPSTETVLSDFLSTQTEKVDLLINNAGHGANGFGIEGLQYKELEDVLAVTVFGSVRCIRACLPFLRQSSCGAIVNISTRFASIGMVADCCVPNDQATYAYAIAKAGLNMLTAKLAYELGPQLRVLSIDPGKVQTRFGPSDADIGPGVAAKRIVELVHTRNETGLFLNNQGQILPW